MWDYIAIIAGSAIIIFQTDNLLRKKFNLQSVGILICAIFICGYGFYQLNKNKKEARYSKDSGVIETAMTMHPLYLVAGFDSILVPGGVVDLAKWQPEVFKNTVLQVWKENGKIVVNADLRDSLANIIVKIERNNWKVNNNLIFDRNFDEKGLEVKDAKGNIILQIDLKDDNLISILGAFYNADGTASVWAKSRTNPPITFLSAMAADGVEQLFKMYPIEPIFKYPSSQFMGVRNQ